MGAGVVVSGDLPAVAVPFLAAVLPLIAYVGAARFSSETADGRRKVPVGLVLWWVLYVAALLLFAGATQNYSPRPATEEGSC